MNAICLQYKGFCFPINKRCLIPDQQLRCVPRSFHSPNYHCLFRNVPYISNRHQTEAQSTTVYRTPYVISSTVPETLNVPTSSVRKQSHSQSLSLSVQLLLQKQYYHSNFNLRCMLVWYVEERSKALGSVPCIFSPNQKGQARGKLLSWRGPCESHLLFLTSFSLKARFHPDRLHQSDVLTTATWAHHQTVLFLWKLVSRTALTFASWGSMMSPDNARPRETTSIFLSSPVHLKPVPRLLLIDQRERLEIRSKAQSWHLQEKKRINIRQLSAKISMRRLSLSKAQSWYWRRLKGRNTRRSWEIHSYIQQPIFTWHEMIAHGGIAF